jgi:glycosyltransferase involved in cell wall biosynthesis
MSPNPLVSVLIPCYNVSAYVKKAILSVINQTYNNLEILIVDDASTDDTLQQVRLIKDERISVFEFKENTQKVGAVNHVLKAAKGDLITFQDADDWSEPTRIEEQVKQFTVEPQPGICFTNYKIIRKKTSVPERIALTDDELKDEFLRFRNKKNKNFSATNCPTMMITREVLEATHGYHTYFQGRVAEDIHWIYRILKNFIGITVDKPLYNYSVREGAFTQLQISGKNAKYAYSWHLLSKIISKDMDENIDILAPENKAELQTIELLACEEALAEAIKNNHELQLAYETSTTYKLGKLLLSPIHLLKTKIK